MQKARKSIIILLVLFIAASPAFAFLKASGKQIVDGDGKPVLLRGYGLGGWLVPEGYMLHIPGFGSPSSIRKQIVDLVGEENAAVFYREYEANYVSEADIAAIASWGCNSVRLPFNYRLLTPEDRPGVYLEEGFQVIDNVLEWCKKYRLYLILDLHCAPGGQNAGNISDSDGQVARLWTVKANQDRTVELWQKIAERYANEEWIGGYDLLNEPVLPSGYSNSALRSLYRRIAQAIRQVDQNHLLFLEGNAWGTDFNQLGPPIDDNMAYSFHKYWSSTAESTLNSYLALRSQQNVPLWLGESGENSNPWYSAVVRACEKNDIGWCWWAHKKVETISSPYSAPLPAKYERVLAYWRGEAGKPTVQAAMDGLMEMARGLKLENCTFLPDVIDALMRPDFAVRRLPFKEHRIPGKIAAVDYDYGNAGLAYKDTRSENTDGVGGSAWNMGWKYRNDGVDIENCSDAQGAPFNIGWIESGEWQKYTVTVEKSGVYDIELRVASATGGGQAVLQLDGKPLGLAAIPNTGGWQAWRSVTLSGIVLEKGTHDLAHIAQRGGYNLSALNFVLKQETKVEERRETVISPFLLQSYPNPFNAGTTFRFMVPYEGRVTIEIVDADGRSVRTLEGQGEPQREGSVYWDGSDAFGSVVASGVYWAILQAGSTRLCRPILLLK
ncbi:MAG: cellulase family glycosylhydrolase [candidate division KSB1 bacterium]|nr:cellulase family glycosylhydrolase [candidate division KSB1 bacterium]